MKRILVIGHPGSGKSTFARKLGEILDLPVIHLDREFWQHGWIKTPEDEFRQRVRQLADADSWIIDGTYDRTLEIRLARADTAIVLDFPRSLCLWRVLRRTMSRHGEVRPDMADGCPEELRLSFLKWVWNYRRDHLPKVYEKLQSHFTGRKLEVLLKPADASRFLDQFDSTA